MHAHRQRPSAVLGWGPSLPRPSPGRPASQPGSAQFRRRGGGDRVGRLGFAERESEGSLVRPALPAILPCAAARKQLLVPAELRLSSVETIHLWINCPRSGAGNCSRCRLAAPAKLPIEYQELGAPFSDQSYSTVGAASKSLYSSAMKNHSLEACESLLLQVNYKACACRRSLSFPLRFFRSPGPAT